MSIEVECPNGHVMKVSDDNAGKTGLCPKCKAKVKVPLPADKEMSEDAILGILGTHDPQAKGKLDVSDLAAADAPPSLQKESEGTGPAPPKKTCPHCNRAVAAELRICPHCRKYIAQLKDL